MNVVCSLIFLKTYEQNKLVENIIRNITTRGGQYPATSIIRLIMARKICTYCGKRKNKKSFPRHILYKDNLDPRCRSCVKKHSQVRSRLHKDAPPKPLVCECCGKIPYKWALDHDHNNDSFRGWLCSRCNEGLGKLGDNLNGVIKAVNYLIMSKNRKQQNESLPKMDSTFTRK